MQEPLIKPPPAAISPVSRATRVGGGGRTQLAQLQVYAQFHENAGEAGPLRIGSALRRSTHVREPRTLYLGVVDDVAVLVDEPRSLAALVAFDTLWLTQAQMAVLFQSTIPNINIHLEAVYAEGELSPDATIESRSMVRTEGSW